MTQTYKQQNGAVLTLGIKLSPVIVAILRSIPFSLAIVFSASAHAATLMPPALVTTLIPVVERIIQARAEVKLLHRQPSLLCGLLEKDFKKNSDELLPWIHTFFFDLLQ